MQPTPAFLPEKSQAQRSLAGCSPWGRTELDMTEVTKQQQQINFSNSHVYQLLLLRSMSRLYTVTLVI